MALQEKVIACGASLTVIGMVLKFIAGPAAMAIGCIAVGLHGDVLRVAIIQVYNIFIHMSYIYMYSGEFRISFHWGKIKVQCFFSIKLG